MSMAPCWLLTVTGTLITTVAVGFGQITQVRKDGFRIGLCVTWFPAMMAISPVASKRAARLVILLRLPNSDAPR